MATVGTQDSNLVFQFNSPVDRPMAAMTAMYYDPAGVETRQCDEQKDQGVRDVLQDARIYSQYNNYLNERWATPSGPSPVASPQALPEAKDQRSPEARGIDRRLRLEELVDKFWLKDGEIDESIFEDSSDEEGY